MSCRVCGAATEVVTVPESAATLGPVTLRIAPVPLSVCARGHRTPLAGLATTITATIRDRVGFVARRGLRRRDHCGDCGARLELPPRPSEKPVPMPFSGGVVTATVLGPLQRCPDCGRDQIPPQVAARLDDVTQAAIGYAVAPPG